MQWKAVLVLLLLCLGLVVQTQGARINRKKATVEVAASEESSEEESGSADDDDDESGASDTTPVQQESQEQRSESGDVKTFRGGNGARITIVSNKNTLEHIEAPPKRADPEALEEQARKSHKEEEDKRTERERELSEREQTSKKESEDRTKREQEAETRKKKEEEEAGKKVDEENKKKAEEEDKKQKEKEEQEKKKVEEANAKKAELERKAEQKKKAEQANKIQLAGGWSHYDSGYARGHCRVVGNYAFVGGLLRGNGGGLIATVPARCRPRGGRLIFSLVKGDVAARVDILPDGRIYHVIAGGGSWLSLNGMVFDVSPNYGLQLYGWVPYLSGYRRPGQSARQGHCLVSGLIRSGSWGYLGRVVSQCYPSQRLIFSGNNHANIVRIDMISNGQFLWVAGTRNHGWISLDGMMYSPHAGGAQLSLRNGWVNYDGSYRRATYYRNGKICTLSGLIKSGSFANEITVLPAGCRPHKRIIFGANVHYRNARVDVLPNGSVQYINGRTYEWISLTGISFVAA